MSNLRDDRSLDFERILHKAEATRRSLSEMLGVELELRKAEEAESPDAAGVPLRYHRLPTGWVLTANGSGDSSPSEAALEDAATVLNEFIKAEGDAEDSAQELDQRYEELNFIYDMSGKVGALLDEKKICDFIVRKAADMLECERASLMLLDEESRTLKIYAAVGLPDEVVATTEMKPGEGISGRVLESGQPIIVGEEDPLPEDALRKKELEETDSFLSIPLVTTHQEHGPQVIGVINLTRKKGGDMFSSGDQKLIRAAAQQIATQIYNCRLLKAERERRELEKELELAARIQWSLLPEEPLRVGGLEAAGVCRQARRVGGDFLDYWEQDGRVCVLVADVCGHDLGAALLAAELRSVIRSESAHSSSVSELLHGVHSTIFDDLCRSELLITLCYAQIDLREGVLSFCRAGHPKPLLIRDNGRDGGVESRWLETGSPLLGLDEKAPFSEEKVNLQRGDVLVIYSDGVMEAEDAEGNFFGAEAVRDTALEFRGLAAYELAGKIVVRAQQHLADPVPSDDMTVLATKYG